MSGSGNMSGQPQAIALNNADTTYSPYYIKYEVAPGIIQHRFYRDPNWEKKTKGTAHYNVLQTMRDHGVYSIVEILEAKTSVVGFFHNGEGLFNPIANPSRYAPNSVVINFGFYVHCPNLFRESENGPQLGLKGWSYPVGETSITKKFLPVSKSYKDLFERRVMTDGSYATAGPSLHEPLDFTTPSHTQMNTKKGRFHYWSLDHEGNQIPSPVHQAMLDIDYSLNELVNVTQTSPSEIKAIPKMKGSTLSINAEIEGFLHNSKGVKRLPDGTFALASISNALFPRRIRNLWTSVPGNISHATEPNERHGITEHPNGTLLSHTYTCVRCDGLSINEQRALMIQGSRFLGLRFEDIESGKVYGLDGGPSIIQSFVGAKHQVQVLSQGGLNTRHQPFPLNPAQLDIREVANVLVVRSGFRLKKRDTLKRLFHK